MAFEYLPELQRSWDVSFSGELRSSHATHTEHSWVLHGLRPQKRTQLQQTGFAGSYSEDGKAEDAENKCADAVAAEYHAPIKVAQSHT